MTSVPLQPAQHGADEALSNLNATNLNLPPRERDLGDDGVSAE